MDIAILLTCYNRKEKTASCLHSLNNILPDSDIYLVDDNSNDGTSEYVAATFPRVNIISGDGNLFWNRGMNLAWQTAVKNNDYRYYLLVNDDVVLYDCCFEELKECSFLYNDQAIISGLIENQSRTKILYGGTDRNRKLIVPNGSPQEIFNLNGNVVLVPKYVFKILGGLDPTFHHDLGDVDYGFRARRAGIKVVSTRMAIASGIENKISRLRKNNSTFLGRIKQLYSPLGSNPIINFYFRRRHFGLLHAIVFYLFQHFLILIPDPLNELIFNDKYK